MLGFAALDHRPASPEVAVWLTSRVSETRAEHTNAVVLDLALDDALAKVHALTRDRIVVLTEGSVLDGLPVEAALTTRDLEDFAAEVVDHQDRIIKAVDAYARETRSSTLVRPTFRELPQSGSFIPARDTAGLRAFQTANYVARLWNDWLTADEERRRRAQNPKTGAAWIMGPKMSDPFLAELPPGISAKATIEPAVAYRA